MKIKISITAIIWVLIIAFFSFAKNAQAFQVQLKILMLTPHMDRSENSNILLAESILRGFGIPFETRVLASTNGQLNNNGSLHLVDSEGKALYYGIILANQKLALSADNAKQALTDEQWKELRGFENKFHVREVSLESDPSEIKGMKAPEGKVGDDNSISLAPEFLAIDPAMKLGFQAPLTGQYHIPGIIEDGSKLKAFAIFNRAISSRRNMVAAAVENLQNIEILHLFYSPGPNPIANYVMGSAWVNWLTRGLFLGKRRIYLSAHVDDLFLTTDMATAGGSKPLFRLTPSDLNTFAQKRKAEFSSSTHNPDFRIEFAYNGAGVLEEGGGYEEDDLYLACKNVLPDYNWVSHTYTHLDLNPASYEDTDKEMKFNISFGRKLAEGSEGTFSFHSLVTPGISGLFNANAIKAIKANGISYVMGDNSVPELLPENPHNAYFTTKEKNGEAGLLVMPREATDIDYNLSLPAEELKYYRKIKENKTASLDEAYQDMQDQALFQVMNYRESPYMFHQANMRVFEYKNQSESLLSLWLKKMIAGIRKYSDLPILSVKMDDLSKIYLNKFNQEKCAQSAAAVVEGGKIISVIALANGSCDVFLSSAKTDSFAEGEVYGTDKTIIFSFKDGESQKITKTLATPIVW